MQKQNHRKTVDEGEGTTLIVEEGEGEPLTMKQSILGKIKKRVDPGEKKRDKFRNKRI